MFKYLLIFLLIFNFSYANENIVFIDINFIFKNSYAGKDLNEKILTKDKQINNEINNFKNDIESEKKKILSQKNVISVEEYNKKITNLESKIKEMNETISSKKNELSIFKRKAENNFFKELNLVIENYSIENSINMIFNKKNLLMAKKELDITQKIFDIFNNKVKQITMK